ncbi:hypothetical protein RD792_004441 [Penstemon davidsonii]|uniref:Peptidase A1 domain-containing protein n=1 Tax=Penstemon davidsonii TaxID=160366 RepID=A0ABR0DHF0_9LAMI|nr:hypothetical protein RD792_004441 [Penstemon davidsonii]
MLRRSFTRIHRLKSKCSKNVPVSQIVSDSGEYIMSYSIGTPAIPSLGIADTGSDIIWTQCKPCSQCFNQTLPFFEPKKSSTYKTIPCSSDSCKTLPEATCNRKNKTCLFTELYGDGSFANGDVATDTLTLGSTTKGIVSVPNVVFGCANRNGGIFTAGESGIVGLGAGKVSLVSQLGSSIQGKFSYCLVSPSSSAKKTSKLNFGDNALVFGEGLVTTPMISNLPDSYYYLTLEGISIGNQRLAVSDDPKEVIQRNIIIDSGTTLTFIPEKLLEKLENALDKVLKLKRVSDPEKKLNVCYFSKTDIKFSEFVVHFKGADVKLNPENFLLRKSNDSVCLTFVTDNFSIYGNLAQMNFLVGYDLVKQTVSFKPTDCSKL